MSDFPIGSNGASAGSSIGSSFGNFSNEAINNPIGDAGSYFSGDNFNTNFQDVNSQNIFDTTMASEDTGSQTMSFGKTTQEMVVEMANMLGMLDDETQQENKEDDEEKSDNMLIDMGYDVYIDYDGDGIYDEIRHEKSRKNKNKQDE